MKQRNNMFSEDTTEKCNCEETSCKDDCNRNHTHKGFSCARCHPERYEDITTLVSLEETSSVFDLETMREAVEFLRKQRDFPFVVDIKHNCSLEDLAKKIGVSNIIKDGNSTISMFLGLPVYFDEKIPKGEVWLNYSDGFIKTFTI